jgi:hypothetical protein
VVEFSEPSEASTVIVAWLADRTVPQPVQRLAPSAIAASANNIWGRRRLLLLQQKQQSIIANADPGKNGIDPSPAVVTVGADVVTVSVAEAVELEGVMIAGENLHKVPAGIPEQENEMLEINPSSEVASTVVTALCPLASVRTAGDKTTEKDVFLGLMVYVAELA